MGTYQEIDVGTTANDGTGDPLRVAMIKVNESFGNAFSNPVITQTVTVGNTSVNAIIAITPSITFANSTWVGVVNTVSVQFSNVTHTANLSALQLRIGTNLTNDSNTTVNTSAVFVGNATANAIVRNNFVDVANSTQGNVKIYPNRILVGANVQVNNQAISLNNASVSGNLVLTYEYVTIANGTSGRANVEPGKITVGANVTINTSIVTSPGANITSNAGLTLGTSTASTNGYTYLPNGLKLVWGTVAANTTAGNATFSDAFSIAVYSVTATGSTADYVYITNKTVANVNIRTSNTTTTDVQFIAIGK